MASANDVRVRMRALNRVPGQLMSGPVCLACGEPLFGPDLLHARSLSAKPSKLMDAIRYAGVVPEGTVE